MHKLAEKIADCMKAKVEAKGIDNIEGQDLVELGMWRDISKDLVCYDKDKKIIEAMDEAEESEEAMKYIEMYEDYPDRRGYKGQRRDSLGRYMSSRRMSYEEPHIMTTDMYHDYTPEMLRDMDREIGRMYYSGSGSQVGMNGGQSSRSENARRGYEESKMMQDGSPESKKKAMESLENYLKELSEDMTDLVGKMDANEKSMVRSKLQTLAQRVQ